MCFCFQIHFFTFKLTPCCDVVIFLLGDYQAHVGRDTAVGIATLYGLDDPVIESWWGARFSAPIQTCPEAYPASYTIGTGSFPRIKQPGRGVDQPHHLVPRLKKEQSYPSTPPMGLRGLFYGELYLYHYPESEFYVPTFRNTVPV